MICARYHGWSFITRLALCLALVISPMTTTAAPMPSFTPIPLVPAGSANAISADGSTVVGTALGSALGSRPAPFRWTAAGGTEILGQPIWSGDAGACRVTDR
jgi:hypothetical protein